MPVFDELNSDSLPMEDREERQVENIGRSNSRYSKQRKKASTSVSMETYSRTLGVVKIAVTIIVLAIIAYAIYYGILVFTQENN